MAEEIYWNENWDFETYKGKKVRLGNTVDKKDIKINLRSVKFGENISSYLFKEVDKVSPDNADYFMTSSPTLDTDTLEVRSNTIEDIVFPVTYFKKSEKKNIIYHNVKSIFEIIKNKIKKYA